jgi:predicted transcriptional regulator
MEGPVLLPPPRETTPPAPPPHPGVVSPRRHLGRPKGQGAVPADEREAHGLHVPKSLAGDHKFMVEMHIAGFTNKEIAEQLGCTPTTVSHVILSPLGQEFIARRIAGLDNEFLGLYSDVIQAVRDGLNTQDISTRLVAADKWLKAHGKYSPKSDGTAKLTAEDVIAKLLQRTNNVTIVQANNVQVNNQESAKEFDFLED